MSNIKLYFCNDCGTVISGIKRIPYNRSTDTRSGRVDGHCFIEREKKCPVCRNEDIIAVAVKIVNDND